MEIIDPIENHRYVLYTPEPVSLEPADTEAFAYPVSVARRFVTSKITLPSNPYLGIMDASDGKHISDISYGEIRQFDDDQYLLHVGAPFKTYLCIDSSLHVENRTPEVKIEFRSETSVKVGARSSHTSPASTVTVPDDPEAVMKAVSTFGSALKTTTPEQAWPTLRGHPPRLERGEELSIPDELDVPDTGVTLHVPTDYEHVFPVAPLAYYLGASVVPGNPPRLTTEDGFVHHLGEGEKFENEVARVLKQVIVLDCVTRAETEGFHPVDLAERRAVESVTDLDFEALYDASLAERLPTYLSVPETVLDEVQPWWSRVTYARPVAESLELLPYIADDLSILRVKPASSDSQPSANVENSPQQDALRSFKRRSDIAALDLPSDSDGRATGVPDSDEYVPLPEVEALERAWVGDGTPVHGTKLHPAAFRHERTEATDGVIEVTVVCNDEQMREEWDTVSEVYGERETVPFEVDCRFGVSTDELRALLAEDHDLFHFIGHIDGRGLACPDGILDAETVSETGATTILLNACRSHDQGVALVEAGARAAIVSWGDVGNLGAVEVGETFARLLNYGFTVGSALEIVEEHTSIGRHYVAVGDPNITVAQCDDAAPILFEMTSGTPVQYGNEVETKVTNYPDPGYAVGSIIVSSLRDEDDPEFFAVPGVQRFTNSVEKVENQLGDYSAPIVVDGELCWTDEWFGDE
ncbi:CHAT domain-containing protein [Halorussus pelagicus]|uniref:hypothetical protein n=1 Tax=Halorussus pelagicus TaxID=2505977 RepID=UPI000FFC0E74|nr:hypothetical protein [Halorussus pelagicus]